MLSDCQTWQACASLLQEAPERCATARARAAAGPRHRSRGARAPIGAASTRSSRRRFEKNKRLAYKMLVRLADLLGPGSLDSAQTGSAHVVPASQRFTVPQSSSGAQVRSTVCGVRRRDSTHWPWGQARGAAGRAAGGPRTGVASSLAPSPGPRCASRRLAQ